MLRILFNVENRVPWVRILNFFVLDAGLSLLLYKCHLFESFEIMRMWNREHFLRVPPDSPEAEGDIAVIEEAAEEPGPEDEPYIICRQCHHLSESP